MAQLKTTDIEGNLTINSKLINNGVDILDKVNADYTKFYNMFCKSHTNSLSYSLTPGANYKTGTGFTDLRGESVYLVGNRLVIYLYALRNSAISAGNVTNETIGTFTINHGGKIKSLYMGSALSYRNGDVNTFYSTVTTVDSNTFQLNINLAATRVSTSYMCANLQLTAELNPNAY